MDKEEVYDAIKVMDKIAEEKGASMPQIALAWLLHQPRVMALILGAKKMSQLEDKFGKRRA